MARALARAAGVRPRDVGYAGRKDRHATTRQWLSVPGLAPDAALALTLPEARVLEAARHPHKLRTGHLRGNRFTITLHGIADAGVARVRARLAAFARTGFRNRFGVQRYGRAGDNARRGLEVLHGGLRPRDRREARFLLSALQSAVFDEVLASRELPLDALEDGDVAVVEASGGLFRVEDAAREAERAARFEISATGPLFGTRAGSRDPAPEGSAAAREARAMARLGLDPDAPIVPPAGLRLPGARRSLRARPSEASVERDGEDLRLQFALSPGCYATVLLEELAEPDPPSGDDTRAPVAVCSRPGGTSP